MASTYIIFSESINKYYIGSCLDFEDRITEHRQGKYINSFTKRADDWIEYIVIDDLEYQQARKIENHIKKMKSSIYIENLKKYSEMRTKLIEKYK